MRLQGKVALITGGTLGIGKATAVLFGKEGAAVAIAGRNAEHGREALAEIERTGAKAIDLRADVRVAADCRRVVDETVKAFGRVDILFNNAGLFFPNTVIDCSEEEWDTTIDVHLKGTFLMCKYVLPGMIDRGSGVIINNSSGWGISGGGEAASYCASKGGVVLLTRAMAIDHSRQGIRINCICPGDVDTPMLTADAAQRGMSREEYLKGAAARPMGRVGMPDEIAKAALFLASDDASFMTGSTLVAKGPAIRDTLFLFFSGS